MSDPSRRQILRCISEGRASTATEIAARLPISRQAVTKHLVALSDAGLVASEMHGRDKRYRLTPAPLDHALTWMTEVGAAWDERLRALEAFLRSDSRS